MPYIPHTADDTAAMLAYIGVNHINDLFSEIPEALKCGHLTGIPLQLSEMEVAQLMHQRAHQDNPLVCFMGAGAYEHHIPAAVWEITTRGEFYSAYTPYQAEASQGTLQVLYEFQTMIAQLTAMDAANASLYDGASALAEAVLMAIRLSRTQFKQVLMPTTVHPVYRQVVHTIVKNQNITLIDLPYDPKQGILNLKTLPEQPEAAALIIPQPNFLGHLEAVNELTDWAHAHKLLVIAVVNPLTLAVLTPPGEWGQQGADIVCGEGQPLGIPLSGGGPYFGFMCCQRQHVRQLPGRIVGRTTDLDNKIGYTLTLQAREQHIRRSKATSNICTNQGLMVTAATIHMALMGSEGLERAALMCHEHTQTLVAQLTALDGVESVFNTPFFHETVIRFNQSVETILKKLAQHHILGGYPLEAHYPQLKDCLLVCATELRTQTQINHYVQTLQQVLQD